MEPTNLAETLHLRLNAENFREQLLAHPKKDSHITSVQIEISNEYFLLIPNSYDSPTYRLGFLEKALGEQAVRNQFPEAVGVFFNSSCTVRVS